MEVWVRPNRRAVLVGSLLPLVVAAISGLLAWWLGNIAIWMGILLAIPAIYAFLLAIMILVQLAVPRVTYAAGVIRIYAGKSRPIEIPVDVVECFFLGQGPVDLPGETTQDAETRSLVIRFAERATEWQHGDLKRSIGHWCDGYLTLNGIWCEPISASLMTTLNQKLMVAQREIAATTQSGDNA